MRFSDKFYLMLANGHNDEESLSFVRSKFTQAFYEWLQSDELTFTEITSNLSKLEIQLKALSTTLANLDTKTHNYGTLDLSTQFFSTFDEFAPNHLKMEPNGKEICSEFSMYCQVFGPNVLRTIIEAYRRSLVKNIEGHEVVRRKGASTKTGNIRILIARLAGIFSNFGGKDSSNETSKFTELVAQLLIEAPFLGTHDSASIIKRAKNHKNYKAEKDTYSQK